MASYERRNSTVTYGVKLLSRPSQKVVINLDSNNFTRMDNFGQRNFTVEYNRLVVHGGSCSEYGGVDTPSSAPTALPTTDFTLGGGTRAVVRDTNYTGPCFNATTGTWQIVFTPYGNSWDTEQLVSMSVYRDDHIDEDHMTFTVTHMLDTVDPFYRRLPSAYSHLTLFDDERALVVLSRFRLEVSEGGDSDAFKVHLNSRPVSVVKVNFISQRVTSTGMHQTQLCVLDGNGDCPSVNSRAARVSLYFTTSNWRDQQRIRAYAHDDDDLEGKHSDIIRVNVSSLDTRYNLIQVDSINITVNDNDVSGLVLLDEMDDMYTKAAIEAFGDEEFSMDVAEGESSALA